MSTSFFRVEISVILLLACVPWPNPSNPGHHCPVETSSVVQKIIQKKFVPILDRYKTSLPVDCPFHSKRDLYGKRSEGPELEGDQPRLACWICGLSFKTSKELHLHYETEHVNSIALQEGAICLADYCNIMRCNVLLANEWLATLNVTKSNKTGHRQQVQQQQQRETVDWNTIDDNSPGKLAAIATLKSREEARRGECNSTELLELKYKCQVIVRNCISGLLLGLSPVDFQEIEEDMNRAVCSFLTCERFWEDSLVEEPRYPLGFFMAVFAMLGIGMIICYYIVWVMFDSGEMYSREEYYKVYVLYSEHLMETKTPTKPCDSHRRRMVQSWGDHDRGHICHDVSRYGHAKQRNTEPQVCSHHHKVSSASPRT